MKDNNRYRFIIASIVILVRSCVGLIWASAGPLLPFIIEEYGISRGSAGWFASVAPITIALFSIPLGIIGARFNMKTTFAVGALLQAAGVLAPFCGSYLPILLTRVLFAMGAALTVPVSTAIAADWFTTRKLPLINSITMTFVNFGNGLAFLITVPLATAFSWRAPITIYGAIALVSAIAWFIFGRNRSEDYTTRGQSVAKEPWFSFWRVIKQKSTILLCLAVLGSWGLWNSIFAWLPSYYHEVFNMPLTKASAIVMMFAVGGTIGCIAGGIISVRMGRHKPMLIISGSLMGLAVLSAILINNLAVILFSIAFLGLVGNLQNPSLFTIPMELPNASWRSGVIVLSVMLMVGNIGNFLSPLVVGYLADITGSYLPGFILFIALSTGSLVAGLLIPETGPKAKLP